MPRYALVSLKPDRNLVNGNLNEEQMRARRARGLSGIALSKVRLSPVASAIERLPYASGRLN